MKNDRSKTPILLVLMSGTFLVAMTVTITATMLPAIMKDLSVSASLAQWLTSGATLVSGVMIPLAAFLMKRIPNRKYFLTAMAIFVAGAGIASLAPNYPLLLAGRLVQAMGCGILIPFAQVVLMALYPKEKHGMIIALYSMASMAAPVIAPTVAGLFIDSVGWKAIFMALAVCGGIVWIFAFCFMKNVTELYQVRLPVAAVLLSAAGFSGLLIGLSNLSDASLLHFKTGGMLLVGLVCLAVFVHLQLKGGTILLDLRVFRSPVFRNAVLLNMIVYLICMGSGSLLPVFTQSTMGYSASAYAFSTLAGSLLMAGATILSGRVYDKSGMRPIAVCGMLMLVSGSVFGMLFGQRTSLWHIGVTSALLSVGSGCFSSSLTTVSLSRFSGTERVDGSAILNTLRQISSSLASIFAITVYDAVSVRTGESVTGARTVYVCYLFFCIIFGILCRQLLKTQKRGAA